MKRGISLPNFGDFADLRLLADLASRAEAAGFDGFFLWDHIHSTGWMPGTPPAPVPAVDPWVALGPIAMATSRIRIGTMVTPLPRRRPWKLARETVTIDHLSGGRLVLGVGLGFPPYDEFGRFGEPEDERQRAELLDDGLAILTGLWSGEPTTYHGKRLSVEGVHMLPAPVQQPRIPTWCAGMWPIRAPFRRAARWDGAFPISPTGDLLAPAEIADVASFIRRHRGGLEGFDLAAGINPASLSADERVDLEGRYAEAGATWLITSPFGLQDLEQLLATGA